jgi:3-phenylpropionate/cinnamic acid dioxygenase small subunit
MTAPPAGAGHAPAQGDPVRYVDDARYARLWALWQEARDRDAIAQDDAHGRVSHVLYREARLLDERRYDTWLAAFAPECIYWIPSRAEPADPRTESGIYLDDRRRMADRVAMVRSGHLHAQTPPSRTRRMLTNIESWSTDGTRVVARANLALWEHRKGVTRAWPGFQVYEIIHDATGAPLIATKIVCLLDRDAPQGNYAFIL